MAEAALLGIPKVHLLGPSAISNMARLANKNVSGWRGPCDLIEVDADEGTAIVRWNGMPYKVPLAHIRKHHSLHARVYFWMAG